MKNKRGNVAVVAIIIVIVAITAGVIGWMFAKKSQAPVQQAVATQPVPVAQQATPTPASATQPVSKSVIYNNVKYGFWIKLPDNWMGKYKVVEKNIDGSISTDGAEISFLLPTADKSWEYDSKNYPGFAEIHGIAIIKNEDWTKDINQCKKDGSYGTIGCGLYLTEDAVIGRTSTHVIVWFHPQGQPEDLNQYSYGVSGEEYLKKNFQVAK